MAERERELSEMSAACEIFIVWHATRIIDVKVD